MEHKRKATAEEYYSDPLLKPMLSAVFNKYRSYGGGRGKIKLVISSQEEAQRLQAFFGPRIRGLLNAGDTLRMEVGVIEEELGKCFMLTIPSLYALLYHEPLLTKKESMVKADTEWESLFIKVIESLENEENINVVNNQFCDLTHDWLYRLWKKEPRSGYRILQAGLKNDNDSFESLQICLKALWYLLMDWKRLEQENITNSDKIYVFKLERFVAWDHALDAKKTLAGRLFLRALEDIYIQKYRENGETDPLEHVPAFMRKRMMYRLYHLGDNSISSCFHKATLDIYESMKTETLNLSNVEEMDEFEVKSNLFLVKNPSVFLYLLDRLKEYIDKFDISKDLIRERFPIMICTSGCFQTAVLEYVRKCIETNSKCRVYFSGDFDRAGIEMMEKLNEYFPKNVSPFQMDVKTYLSGLDGKCRDLTEKDREILAGKNSELARLMALHGKKVYQESIASDLWEVLLREIQCVETISYQVYGKRGKGMENRKLEIFLSYCWQDKKIASDIYDCLSKIPNVNIHRDTIDIKKWDSIKKYMHSIGNMDYTILLISDAYLKSRNCMYEVLELMRERVYRDKIFPAVVSKEIYNPVVVANYVKYWQDEQQQLEAQLSNLRLQNLGSLHQKLKIIQDIASNTADFLDLIGDMNNPDIDEITVEISKKLAEWGVICSEN